MFVIFNIVNKSFLPDTSGKRLIKLFDSYEESQVYLNSISLDKRNLYILVKLVDYKYLLNVNKRLNNYIKEIDQIINNVTENFNDNTSLEKK